MSADKPEKINKNENAVFWPIDLFIFIGKSIGTECYVFTYLLDIVLEENITQVRWALVSAHIELPLWPKIVLFTS